MKAVILAAGKGTRLKPLTDDTAKVMVKVNGKPFLYYVIKHLQAAGCTDFCFIVGYKQEQVRAFVQEQKMTAEFIEQTEQLGTGHAVLQAKQFVGTDNFLVYYADNLFSVADIQQITTKERDDLHYMLGKKIEDPSRYGVLVVKNNKLQRIVEKPQEFVGDVINTGIYKLTPEVFSIIEKLQPSLRGEIELTDALNELAKQQKVHVLQLQDFWLDLGCKKDLPHVEKFIWEMEKQ